MKILYPPRPKGRITPNQLGVYEDSGKWVVQRKFNGTRILVHILGNEVYILNRHGEAPKQFTLTANLKKEFLSLDLDKNLEYWLDGELLDAKTRNVCYKGKIVLFDVLQTGKYLFSGPTLLARQKILEKICRSPEKLEPNAGLALQVTENIWMAQTFLDNFKLRFEEFLSHDEIEGLVLKKIDSKIDNFGHKQYEVGWQIRCRKPHAGGLYTF